MRPCPVCENPAREVVITPYCDTKEPRLTLYACTLCGMRYVDGKVDQEWFDNYYLTRYVTDDKPFSERRLDSLARYIASFNPRNVLDIGGMDGELQCKLNDLDVLCDITGVKNDNEKKYDFVILSHTLEHIYDVPRMFERILGNLGNRLIIEVPVWWDYNDKGYDEHWQHINKFTAHKLADMLIYQGFHISALTPLSDYREYHCERAVAWKV